MGKDKRLMEASIWEGLAVGNLLLTLMGLGIQNEAGQRLIEFCQENALVIASTLFQQHKRRLYTWKSPDGQLKSD